ncbi:hypothetical protein KIN20_024652 [Parelaphostrongylus tenuis]|uniref:Uncharacterized protein n=1 Tax=Parelaphostrongylus tenuis TaxID=148309 RepID=A0AAD5NA51_PARTN|nr:hypothetical protein KIN20_024652 [Parelaphostrongylus tenuis]
MANLTMTPFYIHTDNIAASVIIAMNYLCSLHGTTYERPPMSLESNRIRVWADT